MDSSKQHINPHGCRNIYIREDFFHRKTAFIPHFHRKPHTSVYKLCVLMYNGYVKLSGFLGRPSTFAFLCVHLGGTLFILLYFNRKKEQIMKKALSFLLTLMFCLSMCSCGNNLDKQADEVAAKLEGVWVTTWEAPIGKQTFIYEFKRSGRNAGSCEYYYTLNGEIVLHYTAGTFGVSLNENGCIDLIFLAKTDEYGNIKKLDSPNRQTLSYTYENDVLNLISGEHIFIQTETSSGKIEVNTVLKEIDTETVSVEMEAETMAPEIEEAEDDIY